MGVVFFLFSINSKQRPSSQKPETLGKSGPDKKNQKINMLKGRLGERVVSQELRCNLSNKNYYLIDNLILKSENQTAQIDHVLISLSGVFVIETKNMQGWIFGGSKDKNWTQMFPNRKFQFYNPLKQNFGHIHALHKMTRLPYSVFHSVIVFTNYCQFKTDLPENVIHIEKLIQFIKIKKSHS